jgi:hypothetical protein
MLAPNPGSKAIHVAIMRVIIRTISFMRASAIVLKLSSIDLSMTISWGVSALYCFGLKKKDLAAFLSQVFLQLW